MTYRDLSIISQVVDIQRFEYKDKKNAEALKVKIQSHIDEWKRKGYTVVSMSVQEKRDWGNGGLITECIFLFEEI